MTGLTGMAPTRRRFMLLAATVVSLVASSMSGTVALAAKGPTSSPDTTITSSPTNPSASTSASFAFTSTKGGSTFTCKLDAGANATCTSPKAYSGLAAGPHTFSVYATWKGANDPSPAQYTWTIDTTVPTVPGNLAATTPTATSVKLTWAASTDNLAIGGYDVFRDGASLASVGAVLTYTDSTVLAGSTHTYQVRARDTAGNVSALSSTVSATTPIPPDTIIDSAPPAGTTSTSASISFHSSPAGATFTCKLDAATPAACTSPQAYSGLTQALHTFTVFATLGGIADPTPATAIWTVDTTAPTAPTSLAASRPSSTSVQLTWIAATDNLGVTGYQVFRGGSPLATIGAVTTYMDVSVTAGTTPTYTLQAFDIAGNLSPLSAPVVAPPPTLALDPALSRMPYLTDLVGLSATVNFATDRSNTVASVQFGPSSGGTCSLTTTVPATRIGITVGSVLEYQWKAALTLPATGSYCYRAYLGTVDLLGTNPGPVFQAQVTVGSPAPYTFAVFGDWGDSDATGANPYQAGVMSQMAASGARFAITTGDNGYPSGSQGDYGDLQQPDSGVFGMPFWGGVGSTLPIFPIVGNHGFANNSAVHPHFANWPQDVATVTSGGRNQMDPYPSVNNSSPANYPSSWYAFSAGNARFYMLTATWPDGNIGTGSVYGNDYLAHWTATSPEYQWLVADLAAHPSGLKFAFFHYPLYSDQPSESGDTYLQGNSSLEGLLASNGVNIAFNGHAHIYQRNSPATGPGRQSLVSYVTGGGGAQAQSTGTCGTTDQYAVGWSYTKSKGTRCGAAPAPTSPAQVHHFLKVTINGGSVTVTPTDSTGQTFDVQTYTFSPKPDTFIDSGPGAGTAGSTADFTFHASSAGATYTCQLDAGTPGPCTSPKSYTGLADGGHTFSVYATVGGLADPLPATFTWTVDATAPSAPTAFTADATSPFAVSLTWTASTDNIGVTGYDIYRDGALLVTIAPAVTYTDAAVVGASAHTYAVQARDIAGNLSAFTPTIGVTTPAPPAPAFSDGFESGGLSAWTTTAGLDVQSIDVRSGGFAAEGNTTAAGPYAKKTLPSTYVDGYARVGFLVKSQTSQVNLLRMRDAGGVSLGYAFIETTGQLGFHNDAIGTGGTNFLSATIPGPGWHALELHVLTGGSGGTVELWLDNVRIADLSGATTTGANPIGAFQIGEAQGTNQVYDVVFDDAAFGTARLGPVADGAPTVPAGLHVTTLTAFSVAMAWTASSDDFGVVAYDLYRDDSLLASLVATPTPSYTDTTVFASEPHSYTVRARDAASNASAQSAPLVVTTPPAPMPVFADGFESGDLTTWTSKSGLIPETTDVRTGAYAVEGNATAATGFAKKSLGATYADAYARVGFKVKSQAANDVTILRLRDAPLTTSIGWVYITAGGKLGFHNDVAGTGKASTLSVGPGWHAVELHLLVNGASSTVEVWFDGVLVSDLSTTGVNLGANPVAVLQVGDTSSGTYDIIYDDAAFGTARLGPTPDAPPPTPTNFVATAQSPYAVGLTWAASIDDLGIVGYDIVRDGTPLASTTGVGTTYTDATAVPNTPYTYKVRARDTSGNRSAFSPDASATTPADNPPNVPTDLVATALSRTSVELTWTASTDDVGVVGYDVYRDTVLLEGLGTVTTYTDSTVLAGSTHTYAVLARDGFGHSSALTAAVSATTPLDSPPTVPTNVVAAAPTAYAVNLTWDASTDDLGVVDYDLYRGGVVLASHLTTLGYTDVAVSGGATYGYAVLARDTANNVSALSTPPASVTLPAAPTPTFASGFEATDPGWTTNTLVPSATTHIGLVAAEANLTNAPGLSAKKTLAGAPTDVYARVWFYVKSQGTTNATLLGFRSGGSLVASVYIGTNNKFGVIGQVSTTALASATAPSQNAWHALEFHVSFGSSTTTQVWLDGVLVTDLSGSIVTTGITSTDTFQVGDTQGSGRTYDIVYDDAAFGTSRLGQ